MLSKGQQAFWERMSVAKIKDRLAKLKKESKRAISPRDMQMMKNKYRLWKIMHPNEYNCNHCIFNHYPCAEANKHYDDIILKEGFYCLAFLWEGNYVK